MAARNQTRFGDKTNSKRGELTLITLSNLNGKLVIRITKALCQFQTE